jgi:hypothetical protein
MIEDGVIGIEDAIGQPVVAHELPDFFDRVEFGALGRQRQDGDARRHDQLAGEISACLVHQQDRVCTGCDGLGDLGQMQAHRSRSAALQDESGPLAVSGTDRTKDSGGGGALILRGRRSGATPRPAPGDLVLPTNSGLIGKPDLYVGRFDALRARDFIQRGGEALGSKPNQFIEPTRWAVIQALKHRGLEHVARILVG